MSSENKERLEAALHASPWLTTWLYAMLILVLSGDYFYIVPFTVSIALSFSIAALARTYLRSNIALAILGLIFLFPIIMQLQSLYMSGDLLSALALANADSAKVISIRISQVAPFAGILLLFSVIAARRAKPKLELGAVTTVIVIAAWAGLSIQNISNSELGNPLRLPVLSLAMAVSEVVTEDDDVGIPQATMEQLEKKFSRSTTYEPNDIHSSLLATLPQKPNVIVLFVEGMSARLMEAYGGKHKGLTPNLDAFFKDTLYVDNYYNHTAATLRGLRGQLTSSFIAAREGGEEGLGTGPVSNLATMAKRAEKLVSLPDILNSHGYETLFVTPHPDHMNINELLRGVGISKVVTGSDIAKAEGLEDTPVSDKELYGYLPEIAKAAKKPFFMGVYNFGTHLFQDSPNEKFGDGESVVLNRFHNFDTQFGLFLERFKNSPLSDNTILIVTADHAAFPAPELLQVLDAKPNYFVARIPMMIYWKGVTHQGIDMKGRNSLALAPTVLNLVGIQNAHNYFLGCSIFEDDCGPANRVTKIDQHYFKTGSRNTMYMTNKKYKDRAFALGKRDVDQFLNWSGY